MAATEEKVRTVLITGGNSGIGFCCVKKYLKKGYRVIATYREESRSSELIQIAKENNMLSIYQLDVSQRKKVLELSETLKEEKIDLLINNAGTKGYSSEYSGKPFWEHPPEEYKLSFKTNCFGPVWTMTYFRDHVNESEDKLIINISTGTASITDNLGGSEYSGPRYRISKASLNMAGVNAARDFQKSEKYSKIRVFEYAPGYVQTPMTNYKGRLTAEETVDKLEKIVDGIILDSSRNAEFILHDGSRLSW